jgi:hypothetical protein
MKLWAVVSPSREPGFLASKIVRRYDAVSLRTRLSFQRLSKATGKTTAELRRKMLERPTD